MWWLHPLRDQQYHLGFHGCLAFLHRHFPPQSPPSHRPDLSLCSQRSPCPGIAPQSLNSSSQPLRLPGDLIPSRLPQISCFTLSLKCFSSDSDSCPDVGLEPLLQFPHPLRTGPVLLTLLFFPLVPSSYWVLHGSIYSFQVLLSALRRCCACTSGSEGVFLTYPRREKYYMSSTPPPSCSHIIFLKYGFLQIHVQERDCRIIW